MSPETPANKRTALMAAVQVNDTVGRMLDALQDRMVGLGATGEEVEEVMAEYGKTHKKVAQLADEFMDWLEPGWR